MNIQLVDPEHKHKLQDPFIQLEHDHKLQYHIMDLETGKKAWLRMGEVLKQAEQRKREMDREIGGL